MTTLRVNVLPRAPPVLPLVAALLSAWPAAACLAKEASWQPVRPQTRSHAAAAISSVDNCNDAGAGSLRNAIEIADDPAIIDMTALACSTITLTTGKISTNIVDITLNGPTDHALTISGNHLNSVFLHSGGLTGTLTLDHLNIADGEVTGFVAYGGCIFTAGNLTLQNSTVSNCAANGMYPGRGGGVYVRKDLILNDSSVSDNHASSQTEQAVGGGAYVIGTLTVNRATIRGTLRSPAEVFQSGVACT